LSDNRLGLGDHIVTATASVAHAAGTTAGLVIAAPVAVIDQNTRDNFSSHVGALGATVPGGPAKGSPVSIDCDSRRAAATKVCDR
jgi:hypothetical protein